MERYIYILMFTSPHHGIFIYIFTLAVFMFFDGWYKQILPDVFYVCNKSKLLLKWSERHIVAMHYANCSAEHKKWTKLHSDSMRDSYNLPSPNGQMWTTNSYVFNLTVMSTI